MRAPPLALGCLAIAAAAAVASCHRGGRSSADGGPAPSSSVITIGVALGTCPDISVCERECDAGSADRCRRLAATYALGDGVDKDETRATALYEHACDMKDPSACVFAGQMHEFAHGVPKDDARAARFYERACDGQYAPGCFNLAIMYERGTGVPQDRAKAADLYQVACTAGAKQACDKARELRGPAPIPFLDGGLP
jgi:TPR repeat protein